MSDLGPLPQCHEREAVFADASNELRMLLIELRKKHSLTSAEYTAIVANEVHSFARSLVAIERSKPTPKPAESKAVKIIDAINLAIRNQIAQGITPFTAILSTKLSGILQEYARNTAFKFSPKDIGWSSSAFASDIEVEVVGLKSSQPEVYTHTKILLERS